MVVTLVRQQQRVAGYFVAPPFEFGAAAVDSKRGVVAARVSANWAANSRSLPRHSISRIVVAALRARPLSTWFFLRAMLHPDLLAIAPTVRRVQHTVHERRCDQPV